MIEKSTSNRKFFFALWPDDAVRQQLYTMNKDIGLLGKNVIATNLHITLVYIGSANTSQQQCLERTAASMRAAAFTLNIDQAGCFGQRILWLGCSQTPQKLITLQNDLVLNLQRHCNYQPERRAFFPHVTVQRKLKNTISQSKFDTVEWPVKRFSLIESSANKQGCTQPVYTVIRHWPLSA